MTVPAIYALTEPTGEVRYIGYAIDPQKRFEWHWKEGRKRTHKSCWLAALRGVGLKPGLLILEELSPEDDWRQRECWWIAEMRRRGVRLTNGTDGGEGGLVPASQSLEARAKRAESLRGKECSPETRAKISAANKGKVRSTAVRAATAERMTGRARTPVERARIAAALSGVSKSRRHADNIGRAKRGERHPSAVHTEEQVREIRRRVASGESRRAVAADLGVKYGFVTDVVLARKWAHVDLGSR